MLCKIVIRDEVNCKLEGLDVDTRRRLVAKFKYEVPYARHLPSVKLGRWDGKVAYFQLGGSTYINLLPEVLEWLTERNWDFEIDDQRENRQSFQFTQVDSSTFAHKTWPVGHPNVGQPIVLRDYQIDIINQFLGDTQCVQEVATGAGKTIMTAALSLMVEPHGRTIVIVPSKSLVTQTEADYINLGLDVGVYFGDRKELGRTHTISTWQSLNSLYKSSKGVGKDWAAMTNVTALVVDECFDGDMKVLTPNGYVPIKDIKIGDKVINYSEIHKNFKVDTVVKQHVNLKNSSFEKMYELEFNNGSIIKVTGNHKFLTNSGWVRADELTDEHDIISFNINTYSKGESIYE